MSDNWIRLDFCAKMDFLGQLVNFGVLISKKLGTIFFFYVISKKKWISLNILSPPHRLT
jgi:hypothetical protein